MFGHADRVSFQGPTIDKKGVSCLSRRRYQLIHDPTFAAHIIVLGFLPNQSEFRRGQIQTADMSKSGTYGDLKGCG